MFVCQPLKYTVSVAAENETAGSDRFDKNIFIILKWNQKA